ncbi:hypothetical protein TRAPUB_5510 [Trametes pubescens]|uniref:Uncharacterized protein n=1 Tax=Trametes pubescens TaxID=154538 RepID=A0A1M2V8A1_TRAPU|nr:hypothetical protein TRAPUB_5510 [Trametes pubescens]
MAGWDCNAHMAMARESIGYIRPVLSTTESNKVQRLHTFPNACAVRTVGHSLLELCPATR